MRGLLFTVLGVLFAFAVLTFYPLRRLAVTGFISTLHELDEWDDEDE